MLLEQAREAGVRLVQVSTDEVYGDLEPGHSSREDDPLRPSSPYSAAKAGGDLLVLAHVRTYGVDALITRGSNTYGPNQYPEKVLPLFVTNALEGEPLPLYGDGRQVRDWLYVEDHCAGIELALREGAAGEVYNVGGGEEVENIAITRRGAGADRRGRVADPPGRRSCRPRPPLLARPRRSSRRSAGGEAGRSRPACRRRCAGTEEHRGWWEPIKHSDDYRAYYARQYATRLGA